MFCRVLCLLIFALVGLGGYPALAKGDQTRQMLRLIEQNQWGSARALAVKAGGESLVLYEWLNLSRTDESQDFDRYVALLRDHPYLPGLRRVREQAEAVMPTEVSTATLRAMYPEGTEPVSARGMIALGAVLPEDRLAQVLADWFPDASLSNDEMTMILGRFGARVTTDMRQRRIHRLVVAAQGRQAVALARTLSSGMVAVVEARLALRARAAGAGYKLSRVPAAFKNDPGLVTDRLRFRRLANDDPGPLLEIFRNLPPDFRPLDARSFWTEHQALIYRLWRLQRGQDAYQVAARNFYEDRFAKSQATWMAGFTAYHFLRDQVRAGQHFEDLYAISQSPLTRARAAYYRAMTLSGAASQMWFQRAAVHSGNFFGQRARVLLTGAPPEPAGPPRLDLTVQSRIKAHSLARLARLLRDSGDATRAGLMMTRLADLQNQDPLGLRAVVDLAMDLGLTSTAIKISREAAMDGIDFGVHVYPVLDRTAGAGDVETALVYAIMRQESGFDTRAVSSAGAQGLMQLMPATAKAVARAEGVRVGRTSLVDSPALNARLGRAYVRQLLDQYDGSYVLAAAAYNAGPARVREWIRDYGDPRSREVDILAWIEQIPFYETRNYVQRILEGTINYRQILGQSDVTRPTPLHLAIDRGF